MTNQHLDTITCAVLRATYFTGCRLTPASLARHFGVPLTQAQGAVRRLRARLARLAA